MPRGRLPARSGGSPAQGQGQRLRSFRSGPHRLRACGSLKPDAATQQSGDLLDRQGKGFTRLLAVLWPRESSSSGSRTPVSGTEAQRPHRLPPHSRAQSVSSSNESEDQCRPLTSSRLGQPRALHLFAAGKGEGGIWGPLRPCPVQVAQPRGECPLVPRAPQGEPPCAHSNVLATAECLLAFSLGYFSTLSLRDDKHYCSKPQTKT